MSNLPTDTKNKVYKKPSTKPTDFTAEKFKINEILDNSVSKNQLIAPVEYVYPNNVTNKFRFSTGAIKFNGFVNSSALMNMNDYKKGDGKVNDTTDFTGSTIDLKLDDTMSGYADLKKMLTSVDEHILKSQIFTGALEKFKKFYKYQPVVRNAPDYDEDYMSENSVKKLDKIKLKFRTKFSTKGLVTNIFVIDNGKRTKYIPKSFNDLKSLFKYNSNVNMSLSIDHIWFAKAINSMGQRQYGATLKINNITFGSFDDIKRQRIINKVTNKLGDSELKDIEPPKKYNNMKNSDEKIKSILENTKKSNIIDTSKFIVM